MNEEVEKEEPIAQENTNQENTQEEKSDALSVELAEMKDKYLRLYADFENNRKRNAKEKLDLISNANEDLMKALLTIIDDFERALKSMETAQEVQAVKEGITLIYEKLTKTLQQKGLKPIESAIGKPFDIDTQESITQIPAPNEEMKGKVIDEIEKGYYLNEKIIRFTKVVVGS